MRVRVRRIDIIAAVVFFSFWGAVSVSPFLKARETSRKSYCQSNTRELGSAVQMYSADFGGAFPGSFLLDSSPSWDAKRFKRFACYEWPSYVLRYAKNKDAVWCPSDPDRTGSGKGTSYYWKAAVDRAWYGGIDGNRKWSCRTENDFKYPDSQVMFYERASWHWGQAEKGLTDGTFISFLFMNGHVAVKRLSEAGNDYGHSDAAALGEPAWYNYDLEHKNRLSRDEHFDPRTCGDNIE